MGVRISLHCWSINIAFFCYIKVHFRRRALVYPLNALFAAKFFSIFWGSVLTGFNFSNQPIFCSSHRSHHAVAIPCALIGGAAGVVICLELICYCLTMFSRTPDATYFRLGAAWSRRLDSISTSAPPPSLLDAARGGRATPLRHSLGFLWRQYSS